MVMVSHMHTLMSCMIIYRVSKYDLGLSLIYCLFVINDKSYRRLFSVFSEIFSETSGHTVTELVGGNK